MTRARYDAAVGTRPMAAIFEARGSESGLREAFAGAGLALPVDRNRVVEGAGGVRLMRIGPRRVLATAAADEEVRLEADLARGFALTSAADVANVSDMFAILGVEGPQALAVLKQGAPLDLSAAAFPIGAGTATEMWGVGVILTREAESRYAIMVDRSVAGYLEEWLATANGQSSGLRPGTMAKPPASLRPA